MVTAPRPVSRSSPGRSNRSQRRSPRRRRACSLQDDLLPTTSSTRSCRAARSSRSSSARSSRQLAPFGLANPDVTLLAPGCELGELATVGEGKHLRFRVQRDGRDAGGAIAFGQGTQARPLPARGPLRRRVPAAGEPLERHGLAAARRAPCLRRRRAFRRAVRLAAQRSGSPQRRDRASAGDLRRARGGGGRRQASPARVRDVPHAARPSRRCSAPRENSRGAPTDLQAIREINEQAFGRKRRSRPRRHDPCVRPVRPRALPRRGRRRRARRARAAELRSDLEPGGHPSCSLGRSRCFRRTSDAASAAR